MNNDLSIRPGSKATILPVSSEGIVSGTQNSITNIWLSVVGVIAVIGLSYLLKKVIIRSEPLNQNIALPAKKKHEIYQEHLPPEIFAYIIKEGLIDESSFKNSKEKQNSDGLDSMSIAIETDKENNTYAVVSYSAGQRSYESDYVGIQIVYRDGKAIAHVMFDREKTDYVLPPGAFPLYEATEIAFKKHILDLWENGLKEKPPQETQD